jgi:hypothetical protein
MKTIIFLATIIFLTFFSFSQEEEILYPFNSSYSGKVGYMNSKDEIIIPALYDSGKTFDDFNLYIVTKNIENSDVEYCALFDNKGQLLIGFENHYELINLSSYKLGYILVMKEGKWGYVNIKNEIKIPFNYDYLGDILSGTIIASKKEKFGIIDTLQKVIIDFKFDELSEFSQFHSDNHSYASVKIGKKSGVIDETGKIVIPCIYDFAFYLSNGLTKVGIGNKLGVVNLNNQIIVPIKYDHIGFDDENECFEASNESRPEIIFLYDYKGKFKGKRIVEFE